MAGWKESVGVYRDPKMIVMFILGLFSGLPFVLIFSINIPVGISPAFQN